MKRKRLSVEQIVAVLKQTEAGFACDVHTIAGGRIDE